MKFTSILGLLFLTSGLVHAEKLDQCQELESQMNKIDRWINCENNEEGKINYLNIKDYDGMMSEEDFAIVQSYDTITELIFFVSNSGDSTKIPENNDYFKNLKSLKNLKNLEKLFITYDINKNDSTNCIKKSDLSSIETGTLKDLNNLNYLELTNIKLSQDNVDEISTMDNLEVLQLNNCNFENVKDFSSLSNLKKVSFLSSIQNLNGNYESSSFDVPSEFVHQFKNVKDLYMNYCSSIDFKQFSDIETLWIGHVENINDLTKFKNLREIKISPNNDLSVLEHIDSLKALTINNEPPTFEFDELQYQDTSFTLSENSKIENIMFRGIRITNENLDEILKLKNLDSLYIINCDLSSISDENISKLKELEDRVSYIDYISCSFRDGMEPLRSFNKYYSISTETEYPIDYYNDIDDPEPTNYYDEFENPEPESTDYYTE